MTIQITLDVETLFAEVAKRLRGEASRDSAMLNALAEGLIAERIEALDLPSLAEALEQFEDSLEMRNTLRAYFIGRVFSWDVFHGADGKPRSKHAIQIRRTFFAAIIEAAQTGKPPEDLLLNIAKYVVANGELRDNPAFDDMREEKEFKRRVTLRPKDLQAMIDELNKWLTSQPEQ